MVATFAFGWNFLSAYRPAKYAGWRDYVQGLVWHIFQPRTRKGLELIQNMKDLVRGTIYTDLHNFIPAYRFFKETPGVKIIGIKQKLETSLNNLTVNFTFKERFIGEMQF